MTYVNSILEFLLANPLFLLPILVLVAMAVYAILKKLLKLAAIVIITGVLYMLMIEYLGSGL
jgi:hypothetical protein